MAKEEWDYQTVASITATGGYSTGLTIPAEILEALKLERGKKVKIGVVGKRILIEELKL